MLRFMSFCGLALLASSACTQVLGIEDAYVDSSLLDTPAASGNGGKASTAGNGSTSPEDGGDGATPGSSGGTAGGGGSATSGGSSSSDGGEPLASGGGPDEPPAPSLCERYCDKVMTNCKGKYEQYRTFGQCIEVCKRLPPGQTGDEDNNTVECRLRQAGFAESEPFLYCKSSGPLGAGKCDSNCVSYCSLMQASCTAESTEGNLEPSYFESIDQCLANCSAIPKHSGDPTEYSSYSDSDDPYSFIGNTIFCRTYHLAAGLEQDAPDEHCPHAMGGDPCVEQTP